MFSLSTIPARGIDGISLRPNESKTYKVFTVQRGTTRPRITAPLYEVASDNPGDFFFVPIGAFIACLAAVATNSSEHRLPLRIPVVDGMAGTPEVVRQ